MSQNRGTNVINRGFHLDPFTYLLADQGEIPSILHFRLLISKTGIIKYLPHGVSVGTKCSAQMRQIIGTSINCVFQNHHSIVSGGPLYIYIHIYYMQFQTCTLSINITVIIFTFQIIKARFSFVLISVLSGSYCEHTPVVQPQQIPHTVPRWCQ